MRDELYINNQKVDLGDEAIVLQYKNNLLGKIGDIQSSYSYTISLPKTEKNKAIFKMCHIPAENNIGANNLIGKILNVRYIKDGINIIGAAIGYLTGITEDAFEMNISFGFVSEFQDWISANEDLNDLLDNYNVATSYGIGYSSYPTNIDNLYFLFMPLYNVGVELDSAAKEYIDVQPAIKVSYLLNAIQNKVNATLSFPEDMQEQIKYLAMPLQNRQIINNSFPATRPFKQSRAITYRIAVGAHDISYLLGGFLVNNLLLGDNIEGLFKSEQITIHAFEGAVFGQDVEVTGFKFEKAQKITFKINDVLQGNVSAVNFEGYEKDVEIISLMKEANGVAHEVKKITVRRRYYHDYKIEIKIDTSFSVDVDNICNYFFCLNYPYIINAEPELYDNSNVVIYDAISDESQNGYITITTQESALMPFEVVSLSDFIKYTNSAPRMPAKGNLPDISQVDFLQALCDMFGVFPVINSRPKKDASGKSIIEFVRIDALYNNRVLKYRNGKAFNDWSDRLITAPEDIAVSFSKDGYFQKNNLLYTEDETVNNNANGSFNIADNRLEKEGDLLELPFAASDGDKIVMYSLEYKDREVDGKTVQDREYSFEDFEPRIMKIVRRSDFPLTDWSLLHLWRSIINSISRRCKICIS